MTVRDGTVAAARRLGEALMVDEGIITRATGEGVLDGNDVLTVPTATVYSGPLRVRTPGFVDRNIIFGEILTTTTSFVVWLPWDAPRIRVGDIVTVTTSGDPMLPSLRLRVVSVPALTFVTLRKLGAEVIEP